MEECSVCGQSPAIQWSLLRGQTLSRVALCITHEQDIIPLFREGLIGEQAEAILRIPGPPANGKIMRFGVLNWTPPTPMGPATSKRGTDTSRNRRSV